MRLRVLEEADARHPVHHGILVGIGETEEERVDSLFAIRRVARALRAHPGSHRAELPRQAGHRDARHARTRTSTSYLATVAVARLDPRTGGAHPGAAQPRRRRSTRRLLAAGVDDWGGVSPVTPDHVNPERPWPQLDDLAR